jgi:hypothetical protein
MCALMLPYAPPIPDLLKRGSAQMKPAHGPQSQDFALTWKPLASYPSASRVSAASPGVRVRMMQSVS